MTNSWKDVPETMERGGNLNEHIPDGDTAVISWHGYAAPLNGEGHPASPDQFDFAAAGEELAAFQEGLRASHENDTPSHNSVFGHSWGTMVVGHGDSRTDEHGLNADAIAFVGGPGAGVESAAELSTPEENVHVILSDEDIIEIVDMGRALSGSIEDTFGTSFFEDEFFTSDPDSPGGIKGITMILSMYRTGKATWRGTTIPVTSTRNRPPSITWAAWLEEGRRPLPFDVMGYGGRSG